MVDCLFNAMTEEFQEKIQEGTSFFPENFAGHTFFLKFLKNNHSSLNIETIQQYEDWVRKPENKAQNITLLRELAITYIEEHRTEYDPHYKGALRNAFFVDYVGKTDKDDTFVVHEGISKKFKALAESKKTDEEKGKELDNFWDSEEGAKAYFHTLKTKEEGKGPDLYGSNVELDALGHVLGFRCVFTDRGTGNQKTGIEHGEITLSDDDMSQLSARGVGSKKREKFQIEIETKAELEKQLNQIAHYDEILAFFRQDEIKNRTNVLLSELKKYLLENTDPTVTGEEWNKKIEPQLRARNVIHKGETSPDQDYFIRQVVKEGDKEVPDKVNVDEILPRIAEAPKKDDILNQYRENIPTIQLAHTPGHWQQYRKYEEQKKQLQKSEKEGQPSEKTSEEEPEREAHGIGYFNAAQFLKAIQTGGELSSIIKTCDAVLANGSEKDAKTLDPWREAGQVNTYKIELNTGGRIEHDVSQKRYVLTEDTSPENVRNMLKTISAGGFKKVNIHNLVDCNEEGKPERQELINVFLAAKAEGLQPCWQGQALTDKGFGGIKEAEMESAKTTMNLTPRDIKTALPEEKPKQTTDTPTSPVPTSVA